MVNFHTLPSIAGTIKSLKELSVPISVKALPKTKEEFFKDWSLYAVKVYENAKTNHKIILKENSGKSGIYLWYNHITKKYYIGQSKELGDVKRGRLNKYFHSSYLNSTSRGESLLIKSLIKYKHQNFSVIILEYCPIELLDEREQFWINLLVASALIIIF